VRCQTRKYMESSRDGRPLVLYLLFKARGPLLPIRQTGMKKPKVLRSRQGRRQHLGKIITQDTNKGRASLAGPRNNRCLQEKSILQMSKK